MKKKSRAGFTVLEDNADINRDKNELLLKSVNRYMLFSVEPIST